VTVAQLRALRAAASFAIDIGGDLELPRMVRDAGPRWHSNLRKAAAEISRELALQTFGKGRPRG